MGHQPNSAVWNNNGGHYNRMHDRLTDEQCQFLNENVGISRRTLRDVHEMFNKQFTTDFTWIQFKDLRASAIAEGRCRTTYFRNYFKGENSSEKELRLQKPFLKSRWAGGCQYKPAHHDYACGAPTPGRFCEAHVHAAFAEKKTVKRGVSYIDSSLGKYG